MATFIVYGRHSCQPCRATARFLARRDADFTFIDVDQLDAAEQNIVRSFGFTELPIVRVYTSVSALPATWSGYRPEYLARYL